MKGQYQKEEWFFPLGGASFIGINPSFPFEVNIFGKKVPWLRCTQERP